jgi:hypothetical protein
MNLFESQVMDVPDIPDSQAMERIHLPQEGDRIQVSS